jgi:hypothetical protein
VALWLCDVLWVPGGTMSRFPTPPWGDALDQLGRCGFARDVQGPMHRVHQDGRPVDPPRMPTSAAPVEL